MPTTHDLVIRNGTIGDGTGAEPITGDVAIADGRIAAVGDVDGAADGIVPDLCAPPSDEADVATPALRALVNVVANEAAADAGVDDAPCGGGGPGGPRGANRGPSSTT